jgi:MoaA/NifB/PqqE/SkfB family radical SAM enzyme
LNLLERMVRHGRITWRLHRDHISLPFLIFFINSICNMKCGHCFYWRNLNKQDDLTLEEIFELSRSVGQIDNLSLSGGEPFLRREFADICRQFVRHNKVRQIYVPTNGYFTEQMVEQITDTLKEQALDLFVVELSLDGLSEFHDKLRGVSGSFQKAMETYDELTKLQKGDPRLRIHAASTATHLNLDELKCLTTYLFERCPQMDHHNLAIIRGDRKNPSLLLPDLQRYRDLYDYFRRLWAPRETGRYGAMVEPMLQWAKLKTLVEQTQVIPCLAGRLSAVVYANGDVSVCEMHKPLGNLRQKSFREIWNSEEAGKLRESIGKKECHCATEVFLWPSIVYQPLQLVQAMIRARVWQKPKPLQPSEKIPSSAWCDSDFRL